MKKLSVFFFLLLACNPADDLAKQGELSLSINFENSDENFHAEGQELMVKLYDQSGELVKKWKYGSQGMDKLLLESGSYFMEVESTDQDPLRKNQFTHYAKTNVFTIHDGELKEIKLSFSFHPEAAFSDFTM
ncbi:hypothetical protein WJR50_14820 [Catalinimonas sp. 4WD22]|uniref:hypothetical protein n=1 Tax=Catalinimonas locisalis TaxID=3133978 RepID=UPI003100AEF7